MQILILFLLIGIFVLTLIKLIGAIKDRDIFPKNADTAENTVATAAKANEGVVLEDKMWFEEELAFLFKLNENISLSIGKSAIAERLVEEVKRFMNTTSCVLILEDENTGHLKVEAATGLGVESLKSFSLNKGEGITGKVLIDKQPLLVNDLLKNSYYDSISREPYLGNAFIIAPLLVKGAAIGALNVTAKKTGTGFSARDQELLFNVASMAAIAFQNSRLHERIQEDYFKTITTLAVILDARDPYTKRHSENVTRYSVAIARRMNFDLTEVETIRRAALLHDIGKIGIRDDVLLKPGKLTDEEFEQIKTHPVKSQEIVGSLPFLKEVSLLVRHHHERYDGRGYPDGRAGEDIELGSRILAVSDSFDAMTTDRPYRKRLPLEAAKAELLRCKSSQLDPKIVDYFIAMLENEPAIAG